MLVNCDAMDGSLDLFEVDWRLEGHLVLIASYEYDGHVGYDSFDNLRCVLSGKSEWFRINENQIIGTAHDLLDGESRMLGRLHAVSFIPKHAIEVFN